MEMADFQQTYTYISKEISKKRNPDDILKSKGNRKLNKSDLHECEEWFEEFTKKFKHLEIYDFMNDANAWALAKEISFNSNLAAPDVIHLASAILASIGGYCEILLTKDGQMRKEAVEVLDTYRKFKNVKLKVMNIEEAKKKFFTAK
jgi:predicted nucleic acid-binding protein